MKRLRRPSATIWRHPAKVVRTWIICEEKPGRFCAHLVGSNGRRETRTETGTLYLVQDAIRNGPYRGLPERFAPVVAPAGFEGDAA